MPDHEQLDHLKAALASRYRIERELGRGGMATVYLAEDLKHHRPVAIKVLRPELAVAIGPGRFLREIEITARLDHPHILALLDSGEADGFLFYVMPYVEGESLRDRLNREKQLAIDDAIQITREVADALDFAHQHDVIHRDIKPENILLGAGHARVADFGVARAINAAGGDRLTETGLAVGTPEYMSPEQAGGEREIDGRSDVYALACVLYEMLAGQPPFTGATVESVVRQHLTAPPPSVTVVRPSVPAWVVAALERSLAKNPADRFNPVALFAEALAPREAPATAKLPRLAAARRRPSWARISLILLLAVAVGAIAVGRLTRAGDNALKSLAVLPLTTLSGGPEWEYFADGMTEQLITELAQIEALTVISRTSVMKFKGPDRPSIPGIARDLHVDAVIEGSVLLAGERVRINVQLIEGATDRHLWAHSYEGDLADVLALQRAVAGAIADRIQVTLTPQDRARLSRAETIDPAAHEAYLRGRFMFEKRTPEALGRSLGYFHQATETDPTYAAAHAALSVTYVMAAAYSIRAPSEALPLAEAAARQAVTLDSSLAEGHLALAWALWSGHQWASSEAEFREALRLNAGLAEAHHWYGWLLAGLGRAHEAEREFARAVELDPLSIIIAASWGWALFASGDRVAARKQLEESVELEPAFPRSHWWLGQVYLADGEVDRAITEFQSAVTVSGASPEYVASLGHAHAVAGRLVQARQIFADLERRSAGQYVAAIDLALIAVGLGEADRALGLLERAVAQGDIWLFALQVEPRFDPIRADPRFQEVVRRMGFPQGPS